MAVRLNLRGVGVLNLNYEIERSSEEKAVAHAMDAVVHQQETIVIGLVQPVNTIAQPVAAPDGVTAAVAVAAGVVPTSHVERAIGKVNASRRRCGTRGCSLPDFHIGLCTGVSIDGKRKILKIRREGFNRRAENGAYSRAHSRSLSGALRSLYASGGGVTCVSTCRARM